ncbi:DUF3280 domain-containing protein [Methylocystis heyeri]|uniref:DUF2380 domain-containing protein n=1 Tax=Methylocystis heyeri TaxID=391905 RepID=A0A6B8KD91_9HYPH|nr:DUF3280 domain-containing protein [Methylocystis heyeri]QGM45552.1 DUF2380 domain-containing protein [Methylocystis heyeri]
MKRFVAAFGALFLVGVGQALAAPRLLILNFEILDTSNEPVDRRSEHERRLAMIRDHIAEALDRRGLYQIADNALLEARIHEILARQYLRDCNGCEIELAQQAGAEFVMRGKFNKISTLVGSMDIEIKRVATDRPVYIQNFGFRGDTDEAWTRAAEFFARSLARKMAQGEAQ